MNEQVMIFCIAESENQNFSTLLNKKKTIFYWNDKKFTSLNSGDYVFIVNKHNHIVLLTKFNRDIKLKEVINSDKTTITDSELNENVFADGTNWGKFVRFDIIDFIENIPADWSSNWIHPGAGGTFYLNKIEINKRTGLNKWIVDSDKKEKRLAEIDKLFLLEGNDEYKRILSELKNNINNGIHNLPSSPVSPKPISNNQNEMNILIAIKTKPFILLAGISGTGKSRLVRTLAYKTCEKLELRQDPKKPGNFELIPVRPNWHDSSELTGYVSRINGEKYITTSFLQFIAKAWKNTETPFFLCLDEMNLAPVEQYFAEYLSIIETRQVQDKNLVTDFLISKASFENQALYAQLLNDLGLNGNILFVNGISIPSNLIVIGTVNMDETTHSFSRKVLDRAMTFEMNNVDLNAGLDSTENDWSYPQDCISSTELIGEFTSGAEVVNKFSESKKVIDFLIKINNELEGTPFKIAYRVRDEFLIYCYYSSLNPTNSTNPNWLTNALDEMTSMKILSRIEGDETKTGTILKNLQRILTTDFKKSNSKLIEMETRLSTSGYTSFWS